MDRDSERRQGTRVRGIVFVGEGWYGSLVRRRTAERLRRSERGIDRLASGHTGDKVTPRGDDHALELISRNSGTGSR